MTSGDVGDIDIIVKKKHNTSMGASKTCIKICVGSSTPESAPVAYYESQDLPGLLEAKKRGEVMSIVPVQCSKRSSAMAARKRMRSSRWRVLLPLIVRDRA